MALSVDDDDPTSASPVDSRCHWIRTAVRSSITGDHS